MIQVALFAQECQYPYPYESVVVTLAKVLYRSVPTPDAHCVVVSLVVEVVSNIASDVR